MIHLKKGESKRIEDKNYNNQVSIDTRVYIYNDNLLVGEALIRDYLDGELFLSDFGINKEFRGNGLGQEALKLLMKDFKVNSLTVLKDNERAIHIYKKFGFNIIQEFEDYDGSETLYMKL